MSELSTQALPVILAPGLVEEAVLLRIRGDAAERRFHRARDPIYLLPEADRERAFGELHLSWFERLGFDQPIHTALGELPILAESCARCLVRPALSSRDEGSDLLVASDGPAGREARTVAVRICASSFSDPERLLALLRAELLHVADMVDPAFGYEPTLPQVDDGPSYEQLLRDRYKALWNVSVTGRLVRRGVAGADARDKARSAFIASFPMLGDSAEEAFARFFNGDACTHAEFVTFAGSPRARDHAAAQGLAPGARCPLCRFQTYAPEPAPERLSSQVAEEIVGDFPAWRPAHGLCRQCADLYRARITLPELRGYH